MASYQTITFAKKGPLAFITLNRPRVLNVYNLQMRDELYEALGAAGRDGEVRCIILNGAGDKAFCAGADLTEFLTAPSPTGARRSRWLRDVWGRFLSVPQPIIAALHGYVLGSGIEMALCCDIRIASQDAQFGLPEVALGIIPAAGATQTLARAIGPGRALDLLLTGRRISAQEALELQLVNRVIPRSNLLTTAKAIADKIAGYDPKAVRALKRAVSRGLDLPLEAGLRLEKRLAGLKTVKGADLA